MKNFLPKAIEPAVVGKVFSHAWYDWFLWLANKIATLEAGQSGLVIGVDVQAWSAVLDSIADGDYEPGDLLYWNGSEFVPLNIGSTDQVLTVSAGLPSWQDAAATGTTFDPDTILTDGDTVLVDSDGNVLVEA